MNLSLAPRPIVKALALAGAILVFAGVSGAYVRIAHGKDLDGLVWLFDLSNDRSFPTWYSSLLLLIGGLLALITSATVQGTYRARDRRCWIALAVVLVFLSADEVAGFHEWTGERGWTMNHDDLGSFAGFFYYNWVFFGIAAVALAVAVFLPFVLRQTRQLKLQLLASGAVFVSGALLVEMVNSWLDYTYPESKLAYMFLTGVEETMEILVVLIFIHALLENARQAGTSMSIRFAAKAT